MFRILILSLFLLSPLHGQLIVKPNRPNGVIAPPMLPLPGSPLQAPTAARQSRLKPYLIPNPYQNVFGYAPYWPAWYESPPIVNNYIALPVPAAPALLPAAVEILKARLTLNVPPGSKVYLAGKEVDSAVSPLVLESPELRPGQSYAFDFKVTWLEGRITEERARVVNVDAGDRKSVTYTGVR